jgi:serine/threonine protein kinase
MAEIPRSNVDDALLDTATMKEGESRPATPVAAAGEATALFEPTETFESTNSVGQQIGPYKLLELLGQGGMGSVWLAEQKEPVRRTVALKLIRPGMDSEHVLARIAAERQALALMDHPNIARVFDAGTTGAEVRSSEFGVRSEGQYRRCCRKKVFEGAGNGKTFRSKRPPSACPV